MDEKFIAKIIFVLININNCQVLDIYKETVKSNTCIFDATPCS